MEIYNSYFAKGSTNKKILSLPLLGVGYLILRDAAAVWLTHTRVHKAGKCCSGREIKTEDRLFIVLYPLIWAHLSVKSQSWDIVEREYLYANSASNYASRYRKVKQSHEDYLPWPTLNSDWHNIWGLNEIFLPRWRDLPKSEVCGTPLNWNLCSICSNYCFVINTGNAGLIN